MTLEHVAIWTNRIELLKNYNETYFGGLSNKNMSMRQKASAVIFFPFGVAPFQWEK